MKKYIWMLLVWLLIVIILMLAGCNESNKKEPRYTEAECIRLFKPKDANEADAIAILRTRTLDAETASEIAKGEAKAKIEARKAMERVKLGCLLLLGGSVLALIIGPNKTIKAVGAAGLITAAVIFGVASASERYQKEIASIGLVMLIAGGGFALLFFVYTAVQKFIKDRAFREVVGGGQEWKRLEKDSRPATVTLFRKIQGAKKEGGVQSKSTQKLVDKVKEKL